MNWLLQAIVGFVLLAALIAAPSTAHVPPPTTGTVVVSDSPTAMISDIRFGRQAHTEHGSHAVGAQHSCPPGTCAIAMLAADCTGVPAAWHARVVAFNQDRTLLCLLVSDQFRPPRLLTLA